MNGRNRRKSGNGEQRRNYDRHDKRHDRRDGDQNRRKEYPTFTGRVQMTREGYVFVIVEGEKDDIFVKAAKTNGALNGDTVKVAVTKEKTDTRRKEGEIVEIIERSIKPFVGILHIVGPQAWVLMQSRSMPYDISIDIIDKDGNRVLDSGRSGKTDGLLVQSGNGEFFVRGVYEVVDGNRSELKCHSGMKVAALVDGWERNAPNPHGHLTDVLGEPGDNDTEMHSILAEYALPYRFEAEVENAADSISDKITAKDLENRRDFRDTLTFTIDPEDAKDFDDALSFKKLQNGNFEVGVHIADVSYYVTPGSMLDKEAQARGTSVYLVDRTVPMLPEKLSNKLCSLRPNEDKLTFSAVFELNPRGTVENFWLGRTVICSDYRFAYETAQQIIDNGEESMNMELRGGTDGKHAPVADPILEASPEAAARREAEKEASKTFDSKAADRSASAMGEGVYEGCLIPDNIKEAILDLNMLAGKLRRKRFASGAISFDRPEMKVEVDEKGRPVRVYEKETKEANWLIEEFMLLANRTVAEFVATGGKVGSGEKKNAKTFVYRVHDEPNAEKIQGLREFAGNFGYKMGETGNGKEISESLNELLAESKGKPEFDALELIALRSMAKACYSTDNIGHYGLAFRYYTHFTSPIRRYPDTMVHRLLAMYLKGAESQSKEYYEDQCKHASEREVIAAEAERDSIKYKLVEFMQDKVGAEFEGHISGLTDWGMYVEIEPTKIEGMVALRDVKSDFFEFDEDHYRIVGRRTHKIYRLGDPVKIKVKATNLEQKLLDYELLDGNEGNSTEEDGKVIAGGGSKEQGSNKAARKEKVHRAIKATKSRKNKAEKGKKN
jgi:exoribonuclease R